MVAVGAGQAAVAPASADGRHAHPRRPSRLGERQLGDLGSTWLCGSSPDRVIEGAGGLLAPDQVEDPLVRHEIGDIG